MASSKRAPLRKTSKGAMTVAEAGRKGGLTVRDERGHEFYEEIGRKGGHKVRDLIAAGKRAMERSK
jgi:general stress protein YciG